MKKIMLLAAGLWFGVFVCGGKVFADVQNYEIELQRLNDKETVRKSKSVDNFFNWNLFWSGSWEESKTLNNRAELKLNFLKPGLTLRSEVLGRHKFSFDLEPPWKEFENGVLNFTGSLYHKQTGSRLLIGVLDEYGLSARIRNPWVRSPPYTENHKPSIADLKTSTSSTKNDEAYLYLSSPYLNIFKNTNLRAFASAQTELKEWKPAFLGGLDLAFSKKSGFTLESFFTSAKLPLTKSSSWFSSPPPLPERDFRLYAAGLLYYCPDFSVSMDWAHSQVFAWGEDNYGNLGVSVSPLFLFGRTLSLSLAFDGAGEKFVSRDGAIHGIGNNGEGFRAAGKIEWKGKKSSLFRINSVLRSPVFGDDFNKSSTGVYYRFPAVNKNKSVFKITRFSFSIDRNAENIKKISDGFSCNAGFVFYFPKTTKFGSLGINLSGSIKGLTMSETAPSPYPFPILQPVPSDGSSTSKKFWDFDTAHSACELVWTPGNFNIPFYFQFKTKFGYTAYNKKDDLWDFSVSGSARFKKKKSSNGILDNSRLTFKASSPDFPKKWNYTVTWHIEAK